MGFILATYTDYVTITSWLGFSYCIVDNCRSYLTIGAFFQVHALLGLVGSLDDEWNYWVPGLPAEYYLLPCNRNFRCGSKFSGWNLSKWMQKWCVLNISLSLYSSIIILQPPFLSPFVTEYLVLLPSLNKHTPSSMQPHLVTYIIMLSLITYRKLKCTWVNYNSHQPCFKYPLPFTHQRSHQQPRQLGLQFNLSCLINIVFCKYPGL